MALTKLEADLNIHQGKPDKVRGQADATKEYFDKAPNDIKVYVNDTLTEEIELQFATKEELADVVLGQIPDNTLTEAKMANEMKKDIDGGVASYSALSSIASSPVADLSALKAIDTTSMSDKSLIFCESLGLYRYDSESSATGDDSLIITPTTGGGRWLLLASSTPASSTVVTYTGAFTLSLVGATLYRSEYRKSQSTKRLNLIITGATVASGSYVTVGTITEVNMRPTVIIETTKASLTGVTYVVRIDANGIVDILTQTSLSGAQLYIDLTYF